MTEKEVKRALREYPHMTGTVYKFREELEDAEAAIDALRESVGSEMDGMPRARAVSDQTYNKAQKIVDDYDKRVLELLDKIDSTYATQQMITDTIQSLTPRERDVIEAYYFKGIRWDYIPGHVHMSRRTCFRVHDSAIARISKWLKK